MNNPLIWQQEKFLVLKQFEIEYAENRRETLESIKYASVVVPMCEMSDDGAVDEFKSGIVMIDHISDNDILFAKVVQVTENTTVGEVLLIPINKIVEGQYEMKIAFMYE